MEPHLRPLTTAAYETTARLSIVPLPDSKRLDRLTATSSRTPASAAPRTRTPSAPRSGAGAAPRGSAADRLSRNARSTTPGRSSAVNFTREFDRRCERAGVRRIRVHATRHTRASLDVHQPES